MFGGKFEFDFTLNGEKEIDDEKENLDDDYYEKEDEYIDEENREIDGETLGSIHKDDLTFDHYEVTIFDFKRDINRINMGRNERYLRLIVFPFDIQKTEYNAKSSVAAYGEENDYYNCAAAQMGGKKTFMLKMNNCDFIINGRWMRSEFISMANSMADIGETREVSIERYEHRAKQKHCLHLYYKKRDLYIMPIMFENENGYAPFIVAIKEKDENGVEHIMVGSTHEYLQYENIKIACTWAGDTFTCYSVK